MSHLLRTINDLAAAWQPAIWRASWQGGVALLLAWILCRLLRRAPAAVHCWIWRLAYLKLLVALLWGRPVTLPVLAPPPRLADASVVGLGPLTAVTIGEVRQPASNHLAEPWEPVVRPSGAALLLLGWTLGVMIGAARLAQAWRLTRRWRRDSEPCADADALAVCDDLAGTFALRRPPDLQRSSHVASPLLLGLRRPAVLLPPSTLELTRASDLRLILAHELAHVKRLDLAWDWLPVIAGTVFFFHPLTWLAGREWHASREIACDDLARRAAGASPPEYGRVLLRLIDGQRSRSPATALAVGISERAGHFKRRIRAMTDTRTWSARRLVSCGIALCALAIGGIVPWRLVAQEVSDRAARPTATSLATAATRPAPPTRQGGSPAFVGEVTAATVELRAPVDGTLKQVSVTEGQQVKRNDVLFAFDDGRERAQLDVAKARLMAAKARLDRLMKLGPAGNDSEQQEARSAVEVAEAELQSAAHDVEGRVIRAPIDGTVAECSVVAGQYLSKGGPMTTVVGTDALKVEFEVPQSEASAVRVGQACRVRLPDTGSAGRTPAFTAKVVFVSRRVTSSTGSVRAKALLDGGGDQLRAGMFVTVQVGGE